MVINVDKNNADELKKAIDEVNEHIEKRLESYICLFANGHRLISKMNREARVRLVYSWDSSDVTHIEFEYLKDIDVSTLTIRDLHCISKNYEDDVLESLSFYLKEGGAMEIQFYDK